MSGEHRRVVSEEHWGMVSGEHRRALSDKHRGVVGD